MAVGDITKCSLSLDHMPDHGLIPQPMTNQTGDEIYFLRKSHNIKRLHRWQTHIDQNTIVGIISFLFANIKACLAF